MDLKLIALSLLLTSCASTKVNEISEIISEKSSYQAAFSDEEQESKSIGDLILMSVDIEGGLNSEEQELWLSLTILKFGLKLKLSPVYPTLTPK
jgi:hypothetical protein